jgi:ketosteroid isomerase-like protein
MSNAAPAAPSTTVAATIVNEYLAAWKRKDADAIGACVHPRVHFKGPLSESTGREAFVAGVERMLPVLREHRLRSAVTDGNDAMFVYDFVCVDPIGACRTAERVAIEDNLITDVEVFFDPRPFVAQAPRASA